MDMLKEIMVHESQLGYGAETGQGYECHEDVPQDYHPGCQCLTVQDEVDSSIDKPGKPRDPATAVHSSNVKQEVCDEVS